MQSCRIIAAALFFMEDLINMLEEFVTPHKAQLIDQVLSQRTRHFAVILEDIYQDQNASAVMRTCDCFGIQDLYVTQDLHDYNINPNVVRGASNWVTLHKYEREPDSIKKCYTDLKNKGYKIVGTTPRTDSASIYDLDINDRTAIVFGTEKRGMSNFAKENADELVHIPMLGFTESFNISVSAALIMSDLSHRLREAEIHWQLTDKEKSELKYEWYQRIVKGSDILINNYLKEHS